MTWFWPHAVLDRNTLRDDLAVFIEEDTVTDLRPIAEFQDISTPIKTGKTLAPGLFDVQVNGGGGIMLNNDPTREGVRTIAQAHRSVGTAFILPTVITDHPDVTEKAALAVLDEFGKGGVHGLHIEGPHINVLHKGTHSPSFIRDFDDRTFQLMKTLRSHNLPVLLTLAPETLPRGTIATLSKMGVVVSAGHTAADASQTAAALDEGLRCFTHLFNAMPPMKSRAPGIVGAAINSGVWTGIIADGHHVYDQMIGLTFRARPCPDRMILVSDAMATIAGPDYFEIYGQTIKVEDGRLINPAVNSLAGTHIDLRTSVRRLVEFCGISVRDALASATTSPRSMMRLPQQEMIGAKLTDLFFETL